MFFILSKTLSYLFLPGTLILLCWLAYFLFKGWKYSRILAFTGVGLFIIFTNDFLANSLLKNFQAEVNVLSEDQHFTYGVLLTGMTNTLKLPEDRVYFHQNGDRMLQTLSLYYQGKFDTLIIVGGGATALRKDIQEAEVLRKYLLTIDFPMNKVLIEDQSKNTYEGAIFLKKLIPTTDLLLISSASHLPRAEKVFLKQGFHVTSYPTTFLTNDKMVSPEMFIPSADAFVKWHILFKEWMGFAAYKLAGYL